MKSENILKSSVVFYKPIECWSKNWSWNPFGFDLLHLAGIKET